MIDQELELLLLAWEHDRGPRPKDFDPVAHDPATLEATIIAELRRRGGSYLSMGGTDWRINAAGRIEAGLPW